MFEEVVDVNDEQCGKYLVGGGTNSSFVLTGGTVFLSTTLTHDDTNDCDRPITRSPRQVTCTHTCKHTQRSGALMPISCTSLATMHGSRDEGEDKLLQELV